MGRDTRNQQGWHSPRREGLVSYTRGLELLTPQSGGAKENKYWDVQDKVAEVRALRRGTALIAGCSELPGGSQGRKYPPSLPLHRHFSHGAPSLWWDRPRSQWVREPVGTGTKVSLPGWEQSGGGQGVSVGPVG